MLARRLGPIPFIRTRSYSDVNPRKLVKSGDRAGPICMISCKSSTEGRIHIYLAIMTIWVGELRLGVSQRVLWPSGGKRICRRRGIAVGVRTGIVGKVGVRIAVESGLGTRIAIGKGMTVGFRGSQLFRC